MSRLSFKARMYGCNIDGAHGDIQHYKVNVVYVYECTNVCMTRFCIYILKIVTWKKVTQNSFCVYIKKDLNEMTV